MRPETGLATVLSLIAGLSLLAALSDTPVFKPFPCKKGACPWKDGIQRGVAHARAMELGTKTRVAVAGIALGLSGLLGSLGIIELIGRGYTTMGVGFALVYVAPVCTLGIWRISHRNA